MPRLKYQVPKYRLHKRSGQAVVTLDGRDVYLGKYGSDESRKAYDRVLVEWQAAGRQTILMHERGAATLIDELIVAYSEYADSYYRKHGKPTTTRQHLREALRPLHELYGATAVRDFGPLRLKTLRRQMLDDGRWCRTTINKHIGSIQRVFKWGVENELVPPHVYQGLQAVGGLKLGRTEARETDPVRPVPEAYVKATLDQLSPAVGTMVRLQILTGMRPGEVVLMRGTDLDTQGASWTYTPAVHKTEHHGRQRIIYLGPRAQDELAPWLKSDLQAYIFSPAQAEEQRNAQRRADRATRITPSQSNRQRNPNRVRPPGPRYSQNSYRRAIHRACDAAFPPPARLARAKVRRQTGERWETTHEWRSRLGEAKWQELQAWRREHRWSPNQLRHNAATHLRKQFGIEAARVVLGHSSAAVTEVYAEMDLAKAADIMAKVG